MCNLTIGMKYVKPHTELFCELSTPLWMLCKMQKSRKKRPRIVATAPRTIAGVTSHTRAL
jgi:hypothetical protein